MKPPEDLRCLAMRRSSAVGAGLAELAMGVCGGASARPGASQRIPVVTISYDGTAALERLTSVAELLQVSSANS